MQSNEETTPKSTPRKYRWLRRLARVFLGFLFVLIALIFFIRSEWGQSLIVDQAIGYVEGKTGANVDLESAYVTFDGNIQIEGLYLEDLGGDTLIYSKRLEANIPIFPILQGNGYAVEWAQWDGVTARIYRQDSTAGFNYQFLIDSFAPADTTKATTNAPLKFELGEIELSDFDITYDDQVENLDAVIKFEQFYLEMNKLDLEQSVYDIDQVRLTDAIVRYNDSTSIAFAKKNPPLTETAGADTSLDTIQSSILPKVKLGNLTIENSEIVYTTTSAGLDFKFDIGNLQTSMPMVNIADAIYTLSFLNLKNTDASIKIATVGPPEPFVFEWPQLTITANNLNVNQVDIFYQLDGAVASKGTFNPNAIDAWDINLVADNLKYKNREGALDILEFTGKETSGLDVKQFNTAFEITDNLLAVKDLKARVNNNLLQTDLVELGYQTITALINDPVDISINAVIPSYKLDLKDLFLFQPQLQNNEYLSALSKRLLTGSLKASGTTAQLGISNLVANWGQQTGVIATGSLSNILDIESLKFNFPSIKIRSTRDDVLTFTDSTNLPLQLPKRFSLAANAAGTIDNIMANAYLKTSAGSIEIDGSFNNAAATSFNATAIARELDLGLLLDNAQLGLLNLEISTKGTGTSLNNLDATIDATVNSFTYGDYTINNLPINGSITNGSGEISSSYRDDNVNINLDSQIVLDSIASQAQLQLNVVGVDLQAFGVTNRDVRAAGNINATFKGNLEEFTATTTIKDGIAVYDSQSYLLGNLDVKAFVQPDSTSININNKMLDLQLRSNTGPIALTAALQRHVDRYLTDNVLMDSIQPVVMRVAGNLRPTPILRDVILPSLQALDTVQIAVDFNEKMRKLDTDITAPYIKYMGSEIDSLIITSRSNAQDLNFNIGFDQIKAGPINLSETRFSGKVDSSELILDFISYHNKEKIIHLGSSLSRKRDQNGLDNLVIKINLEDLILNKQPWRIPADNSITVGGNRVRFNNFNLTNSNQKIELRDDLQQVTSPHIGVLFENFKLQALLSYFNPEEKLATGSLNGRFVLEDIASTMGFASNLSIENLGVLQVPLGDLNLNANSNNGSLYEMDLSLLGQDVDLDVTGTYNVAPATAALDLNLQLNKLNMETLTGIASDYLSQGSGQLSGAVDISGTTIKPQYNGELAFDNANFNVNLLNAAFTLNDEQITFDNNGIYFNTFTVADASDNIFTVNGKVETSSFLNPSFDLQMNAQNFTVLNSTAADNDLYYGTATFNAAATLTGDLAVPKVDVDFQVLDGTNVTYVIPPTELDVIQRDGIVQFVNKENPDAILTQTQEETARLSGFDITANLKIGNGAIVNVIVDPDTGDNLQISGAGDLKFAMSPNGRMTLAGRYEINDGFYELSLYDIVSRKFDIAQGSTISWAGDPFEAQLDASAIYQLEASASALMASQISGADASVSQKFRQELPFLVYLNVDGELLQPKISFSIDMPEDEQGAIGGQVYGRLQQLNNQEQELNKQVFSLLVLNRFFPTSGADGSDGGTAAIARDNINQALSDQLNQFGGQLLGDTGVDLNFGLDSFTDYQGNSPQSRTQLEVTASKKLLDDRLIVSVGSDVDIEGSAANDQTAASVIGNVSIEYLITPSGRWRLKGFRRNEFDNVIDGQLIVSGIGVIFTREFNEFKNLFSQTLNDEKKEAASNKSKPKKDK